MIQEGKLAASGFWWILLGYLGFGVLHSVLASLRAKTLAARWLGEAGRRGYRLFFNLISVLTFLPLMVLIGILPDRQLYAIPLPWALVSGGLQIGAAAGLLVSVLQTHPMHFLGLEQLARPDSAGDHPRDLVVSGAYRYVRHPLYFFSLVILWLSPVMSWNVMAFNLGATAYMALGAWLFEEPKLVEAFGDQYRAYQQTTPMLIPLIKLRKK
jgi:protein-S-isoprenylcysteine O-methyltransferase Ste14